MKRPYIKKDCKFWKIKESADLKLLRRLLRFIERYAPKKTFEKIITDMYLTGSITYPDEAQRLRVLVEGKDDNLHIGNTYSRIQLLVNIINQLK